MSETALPRLLAALFTIVIFGGLRASADLQLTQRSVIGFPIDGVVRVTQIDPNGSDAHRLAVLGSTYLVGLQWSPQRKVYDQLFFQQLNNGGVDMTLADVDGDSRDDIVVITQNSLSSITATAYDSRTGAVLETFGLPARPFSPIQSHDIDGLRGSEMIVGDGVGVSAYKSDVVAWRAPVGGAIMAPSPNVAELDEILISSGTAVVVLDARTGTERRRLPLTDARAWGLGPAGTPVVASTAGAGTVQLSDAITGAVQWTRPMSAPISRLTMFDADGDGVDDVLVRVALPFYSEVVMVLNGKSGAILGSPAQFDASGAVIGITNGCEPPMVVALSGGGLSTPDALWLLDAATLNTLGTYSCDAYGITGFTVGDFDGDGRNEVAVAHDGKVSVLRVEPLSASDAAPLPENCCSFQGAASATFNGRTAEPVFASNCDSYTGCVVAWDASKRAVQWKGLMGDGEMPRSVSIADVDADGVPDVLSMSIAVHSGAKGTFVYAYSGRDGRQLWRSLSIPGSTGMVRAADVEGKGVPQVIALSDTIGIVRLDAAKGTVSGFDEFTNGRAFATYTINGDSRAKIITVAGDRLFVLDRGEVKHEIHDPDLVGTTEIQTADLDGDGVPEILLAQELPTYPFPNSTRLQVRSITTLAPLWTSELFPMLLNFGQADQIVTADVNNDGRAEVVFLTSLTLRVFDTGLARPASVAPVRFRPDAALHANVFVRSPCCATVHLEWNDADPGDSGPVQYRVYRDRAGGASPVLLATTSRHEFADVYSGGAGVYRYIVEAVDFHGNAAPQSLQTDVTITGGGRCRRPAGKQ